MSIVKLSSSLAQDGKACLSHSWKYKYFRPLKGNEFPEQSNRDRVCATWEEKASSYLMVSSQPVNGQLNYANYDP